MDCSELKWQIGVTWEVFGIGSVLGFRWDLCNIISMSLQVNETVLKMEPHKSFFIRDLLGDLISSRHTSGKYQSFNITLFKYFFDIHSKA